ncbi:MAG: hypothetical protein A2X29_08090 [Elusimicrobia bacterium GWA2_64_40]|nr:MAG: hypothetical protein A2X29_08090 [Elusimicrobia bacterium GWA2_64_40]OGR66371.1 MAG: hypothetical protein A2X30_10640 [Elusimicrobia bacterium GWB2_63_16]HAN03771.1 hypothetical protein [Elusimicrobiota bacterium]
MRKLAVLILFSLVCQARPLLAQDAASLQFTVAAPDPVMAGEEVTLQTLAVNSGASVWERGSYYWIGEVYAIEGEGRRFLTQTASVSPAEDVAPGAAQGVQLLFRVPDNLAGRRLLYRVFLIKDGRRILETDFKGFQVIEKELRYTIPEDFKIGGDVSFTYKNNSRDGWDHHQGITSANLVGKIRQSSFLFNTYVVHTYHRPITPTIVLLNYYAPWGTLSIGDISPTLTPLSMDGQGMRGVSFERARGRYSLLALVGRIVAPEEPGPNSGGRFARYTSGLKAGWQFRPNLKVSVDAVMSRDDMHSINITTAALTIKPQQTVVYGLNAEWKFLKAFSLNSDYQMSAYKADMEASGAAVGGSAWKQELKYRADLFTARGALSRIDPKFYSFGSPSVIPDRQVVDAELGLFPADWTTFTVAYNAYTDNLDADPAKTTTDQAQTTLGNMLRILGKTVVNTSIMTNTAKAQTEGVQDNQTTTLNLSVTQPLGRHTLSAGLQQSSFKDNLGLSHDLDSSLLSLNGSFKINRRLSLSTGLVSSATKDKVDSSTGKNNSLTGSLSYAIPRRGMAVQCWATLASAENDSPLSPSDNSSVTLNVETVWLKSQNSRFTFGVGGVSRTDNLNPAADETVLNVMTRYNYSF